MTTPAALAAVLAVAVGAVAWVRPGHEPDPEPSPDLTAAEVVRLQVEALRDNGADDAGIATAFRFASPGNRAATGPLPRFTRMVREGYSDMLGFERAEYGPITLRDDMAAQEVTFIQDDGRATTYGFVLSRQSGGACDGCWMTDAVVPLDSRSDGLTRV